MKKNPVSTSFSSYKKRKSYCPRNDDSILTITCSLDALEDKPLKSLDLVKAENGERPIPPRPAPPAPASATNGEATHGNGIQTNGHAVKHSPDLRGGDVVVLEEPAPLTKRPRSETDADDQTTKRPKLAATQNGNAAVLIEDDDGAIVLD